MRSTCFFISFVSSSEDSTAPFLVEAGPLTGSAAAKRLLMLILRLDLADMAAFETKGVDLTGVGGAGGGGGGERLFARGWCCNERSNKSETTYLRG